MLLTSKQDDDGSKVLDNFDIKIFLGLSRNDI